MVRPEQFVIVWQTSDSREEVVRRTGMSRNAVDKRERYYRDRGVQLKEMEVTRERSPVAGLPAGQ